MLLAKRHISVFVARKHGEPNKCEQVNHVARSTQETNKQGIALPCWLTLTNLWNWSQSNPPESTSYKNERNDTPGKLTNVNGKLQLFEDVSIKKTMIFRCHLSFRGGYIYKNLRYASFKNPTSQICLQNSGFFAKKKPSLTRRGQEQASNFSLGKTPLFNNKRHVFLWEVSPQFSNQ